MCSVLCPSNCVQKHSIKNVPNKAATAVFLDPSKNFKLKLHCFSRQERDNYLFLKPKNALFLFSPPSTSKTFSSRSPPCPSLFTTVKISHFHSQDQTHDHHNPLSSPPTLLFSLHHQSEPKKPNPKSLFVRFKNSYNWLWQLWPIPRQDPHFSGPHSPCSLKIRPFSCSQIPWCLFLFGPS